MMYPELHERWPAALFHVFPYFFQKRNTHPVAFAQTGRDSIGRLILSFFSTELPVYIV